MVNMEVDYCGVKYRNPLVLASAAPSWDGLSMKIAGEKGCGGVIPKTIGPQVDWAAHPRNGRIHYHRIGNQITGPIDLELFTTMTREDWTMRELAIAKEGDAVMQISVLAMPDPDDTAKLVEEIQDTGLVDVFELNVSCPMPKDSVGMHIGKNPDLVHEQVKAATAVSKHPFTVKLTPNVSYICDIAQAVKEAGGAGVTLGNSLAAIAGVDIESGKLIQRAFGALGGPAIKPVMMRHVADVAMNVGIPISAVGGVCDYKDVIEYIMLGATTVQLCTTVMINGYDIITKILTDLQNWMDKKGYKSFDEIRGIALSGFTSVEELAKESPMHAIVDRDSCVNCSKCENFCMYRAFYEKDGKHEVDRDKCDGCNACTQLCPVNAISFV